MFFLWVGGYKEEEEEERVWVLFIEVLVWFRYKVGVIGRSGIIEGF